MMHVTPEKQAYAALGLSLAVIALVVILIAAPTLKRMRLIRAETTAIQIMLEDQYSKSQQLRKANLKLPHIKTIVNAWDNALLTPETELQFIRFVEGLAALNNLVITLKPRPVENAQAPLKHGFSLDIQLAGGFQETINFLSALEQADYYVVFNAITMNRAGDPLRDPVLMTHIFGNIYVR